MGRIFNIITAVISLVTAGLAAFAIVRPSLAWVSVAMALVTRLDQIVKKEEPPEAEPITAVEKKP